MVEKVICDGCGNSREKSVTHAGWGMMSSNMTLEGKSSDLNQDLCQRCAKKVRDFIRGILTNQG